MFDRKIFFDHIRPALFPAGLSQDQVNGISADLDCWETNYLDGNPQHLAYILATDYWETAKTMQPIPEYGGYDYLMRMYDITGSRPAKARELGNTNIGDGAKYTGGKVQLTGRSNFRRMGEKLGVPLERQPELIYDMNISTLALVHGMMDGVFTGKSLADYTDLSGNLDSIKARRVVNGNDRAKEIAAIFALFWDAIQAASSEINTTIQVSQSLPVAKPADIQAAQPLPADYADYRAWVQDQQRKAASKSPLQSKILLTVFGGLLSVLLARFGVDLPAEESVNVVTGIASACFTAVGIFRLFFTNKNLRKI